MRSYAHVVIIGNQENFFHVAAPEISLKIRSRARICEEDFDDLRSQNDLCFVVRPNTNEIDQEAKCRRRAEACLDIQFDYDAENCNCETFANAVHGEWGEGLQVRATFVSYVKTLSVYLNPSLIFRNQQEQLRKGSAFSQRQQN